MAAGIHPAAIIEPGAEIGEGVSIGPYCHVGPEVKLERGVTLVSHVVIAGGTRIGSGSKVYPFASLGQPPQDLKYRGEPARLRVGRDATIREHVTINIGTEGGGMETQVGDGCLIMAGAHIAHDCRIGNGVILANQVTLAGHVVIEDEAVLGGLSAVHQFVRIGRGAMVGGMTGIEHDLIPFGLAVGERARLAGLNLVGLRRRGASNSDIHRLRAAYRCLFEEEGALAERIDQLTALQGADPWIAELLRFLAEPSDRAILQPAATAPLAGLPGPV